MSNFTHSAQEVLNRCFRPADNALALGASQTVAAGHNVTYSEQEIWNRIFLPDNNVLKMNAG